MKSTPCAFRESTAATAVSGVVTAMELGKRNLPSGRTASSMGPETIIRGPMISSLAICLRQAASTGKSSAHIANPGDTNWR